MKNCVFKVFGGQLAFITQSISLFGNVVYGGSPSTKVPTAPFAPNPINIIIIMLLNKNDKRLFGASSIRLCNFQILCNAIKLSKDYESLREVQLQYANAIAVTTLPNTALSFPFNCS